MRGIKEIKDDLKGLGIKRGDVVLMHSSYKSLGAFDGGAEAFFEAFMQVLGDEGTLIVPSLSFDFVTREKPLFNIAATPSCVGYLSEFFRTQVSGVKRSMHPTHSCCALGMYAEEITSGHENDITPVGKNSPFAKLPEYNGKILMLGCGTSCNTSMHGVEETAEPPYCIDRVNTVDYILKDGESITKQNAYRHNFTTESGEHIVQRYDRIVPLLCGDEYKRGYVLDAQCHLLNARAVWQKGRRMLLENPLYFVDYPN